MHIVSREKDKKFPECDEFKKIMLECISVLCLCRSLDDLKINFTNICYLFQSKRNTKANDSLKVLNNIVAKQKSDSNDVNDFLKLEPDKDKLEEIFHEDEKEASKAIDRNSPFFKEFNHIFSYVEGVLINEGEEYILDEEVTNEYDAPLFLDYL